MDSWITDTQEHIRAASLSARRLRVVGHDRLKAWLPPDEEAVVLTTQGYEGVVSYEPSELVVTVRAGTSLKVLQELLKSNNQCLPFDPPVCERATVGGMVASGLAGSTRVSAGSVRDYVLGAHVINGRGEYLQLGGQVMKNVAGYDIGRLYAGSWGTLGVMAQVSLKVMPIAPADMTLAVSCSAAEALALLAQARPQPWPLAASLWLGQGQQTGQLTLRWRGAQAAVSLAHQSWSEQLRRHGKSIALLDVDQAQHHWAQWRDMQAEFFNPSQHPSQDLWRSVVPWEAPLLAATGWHAMDWHGGLRWQWHPTAQREGLQAQALAQRQRVFRMPGTEPLTVHPLAWHGLNVAEQTLQQRVQSSLDPNGVFLPVALRGGAC